MQQEWDRVHDMAQQGRTDEALAGYLSLCEGHAMARACYDHARLLFEAGKEAEGRTRTLAFVRAYPQHALVQPAVKRIARSYRSAGEQNEGIDVLERLAEEVKGSESWDTIEYARAGLFRSIPDLEGERAVLMRVVDAGRWGSQLWDNAIWRAVEIARAQKKPDEEKKLIRRMLDAREESRLIASYHSPHYDDGLLRLGVLYEEEGNVDKALSTWRELIRWKTSRLRDDALLRTARLFKQQGDMRQACRHLQRLLDEMGDSSSAREARKLRVDWGC